MKEFAKEFYSSTAWEQCRYRFMLSKYFICNRCGGAAKIAHHITYLTPSNINNFEISLSWANLEALCQDCHNKEHHGARESAVADGFKFNEYGELVKESEC